MSQNATRRSYVLPRVLAIFLFSAFFVLFDWRYSSITILLLFFLTAVSMMVLQNGRLRFHITFFHIWMLVFGLFCLFGSIWAWDTENAVTKGKTVFSMLLCYSLVYFCYQEFDSVDALLKSVLWGGNAVMLVVLGTFGYREILRLLEFGDRLSEQFYLNSNVIGVVCAMSVVVNLYYILKEKRLTWWNLFLILGIVVISASGSRQALAVAGGGAILLCGLLMLRGKSPAQVLLLFLVGVVAVVGLLFLFSRISAFSGIYRRIRSLVSAMTGVGSTDRSATTRLALIDVGMAQLRRTPLLGIGMGSGHLLAQKYLDRYYYLHNNFAEILAGGGITGFVLYYSIYLYLLIGMIRYRRFATQETAVCVTLLLMALIEDYASVTYYAKETYFYLMIGMLEVDKLHCAYRAALPCTPSLQMQMNEGCSGGYG